MTGHMAHRKFYRPVAKLTRPNSDKAEKRSTGVSAQQMRVMGKMVQQPFSLFESQGRVNPNSALALTSVFCAITRISTDLARLPMHVYKRRRGGKGADLIDDHYLTPVLSDSPDGGQRTSFAVKQQMGAYALGFGDAIAEIETTRAGKVIGYHPIHPSRVEVEKRDRAIIYKIDDNPPMPADKFLHYYGLSYDGLRGISPIRAAATSLAVGMSGDAYSLAFYQNGSVPSGFIKYKGKYAPEIDKAFKESWNSSHQGVERAHRMGLLFGDAEFIAAQVSPIDAQLLESRRFTIADVARIYSVPLSKLMEWTNSHFSNYEESQLDYVASTIMGWCECIEQAYSLRLLSRAERAQGYFIEHEVSRMYRGNMESLSKYYTSAIQNGWKTQNDVRHLENDPPVDGGDTLFIQRNMMPVHLAEEICRSEIGRNNQHNQLVKPVAEYPVVENLG